MKTVVSILLSVLCLAACGKVMDDPWVETKDISVTAYKSDPENGKQYLELIYENTGKDNIRKLKIELLEHTGNKVDTVMKEITPAQIVHPKDRHLAPRPIGEPEAKFALVEVGRVWIVKE